MKKKVIKESIIVPENPDDGWGDDIESTLSDLFDRVDRLAYEVRNARRGSYADFGNTPDDLIEELYSISEHFNQVADEIQSDEIEFESDEDLDEACKGKKKKPIKENVTDAITEQVEDMIKRDIEDIIAIGFNGTDFTVSVEDIDLFKGEVKCDVIAYGGDEEEYEREITLHFPSLDYRTALEEEIENWMAEHGSPDSFYESVEPIKEAKGEPKYNLVDLRGKTAKDVKEDFKKFYKDWIFTWEGMLIDDNNLNAIVKELKLKNPTFYTYTGKQMNSVYGLHGSNAYPADLNFLSIEDFQDPVAKMRYGARWFTDIVDNNRWRENSNRRSKNEGVNLSRTNTCIKESEEKNTETVKPIKEAGEYYKELNLKRLEAILKGSTK